MKDCEGYAFFDVDGTIRKGSASYDFLKFLVANKVIEGDWVDEGEKLWVRYEDGELGYKQYCDMRMEYAARSFKGLKVTAVSQWQDRFIELGLGLSSWVDEVMGWLREEGYKVYLVSAGMRPAIEAIGKYLDVDSVFATEFGVRRGVYDGKVRVMMNDRVKAEVVERLVGSRWKTETLGFGDSVGDVEMLGKVSRAMVVEPRQDEMRRVALKMNWTVIESGAMVMEVLRGETKNSG